MKKLIALAVLAFAVCDAAAQPSFATERVEKKIMQFGGPETRIRCIGNLKTKGIPTCSVEHWHLTCHDNWIEACTQWATDFYQHEIFLVASGPDAPEAAKQILENALEQALGIAVATGIATPGEAAVKLAAAVAAFKIAIVASLSAQPLLAALKDQYTISVENRGHW